MEPGVRSDPTVPAATGTVRLATANLLHGMQLRTGQADPARLREAAAGIDADVIALQEVDVEQFRSGGVDQVAVVADAAGLAHRTFRATVLGTPGGRWVPAGTAESGARYGIGLASRWPLTGVTSLDLGWARAGLPLLLPNGRPTLVTDEPRAAVAARIHTPLGPLTVACAHVSFVPGWNLLQLRRLTRWLESLPGPRVLLADLNMPLLLTRTARGWRSLAAVATYPSPRPRVQFDHVLASGELPGLVSDVRVHRMPVSDHRALTVTLTAPPAGS